MNVSVGLDRLAGVVDVASAVAAVVVAGVVAENEVLAVPQGLSCVVGFVVRPDAAGWVDPKEKPPVPAPVVLLGKLNILYSYLV